MKALSITGWALAHVIGFLSGMGPNVGAAEPLTGVLGAGSASSLPADRPAGAGNRTATRPPPPQEPADYTHPPRAYDQRAIRGWTVWVEKELIARDPVLADQALSRFERKLAEALDVLPRVTRTNFQPLSFFLLNGKKATSGGRDNGLEYFTRAAPEHYAYLDPRMGRSIVVYSAENYPFNREQLRAYDPAGFLMVRKLWRLCE